MSPTNPEETCDWKGQLFVHRGLGRQVSVPQGFRNREIFVYLSERFCPKKKHPLLLVLDGQNAMGQDSLRDWQLIEVIDKLCLRSDFVPPIVVGVSNGRNRLREYIGWSREPGHRFAAGENHHDFLVESLLPWLKSNYPIRLRPRSTVIMGASAGGAAALYTAFRNPELFAGVALLSTGRHYLGELLDRYPQAALQIPRLYVSCGDRGMDEELLPAARNFAYRINSLGAEVRFRLRRGAWHVESAWAKVLPELLNYFFTPQANATRVAATMRASRPLQLSR